MSCIFELLHLFLLVRLTLAQQGPSWSTIPFNAPALPLAVKSPFLSAWNAQGSSPVANGRAWPKLWNVDNVSAFFSLRNLNSQLIVCGRLLGGLQPSELTDIHTLFWGIQLTLQLMLLPNYPFSSPLHEQSSIIMLETSPLHSPSFLRYQWASISPLELLTCDNLLVAFGSCSPVHSVLLSVSQCLLHRW